MLRIFVSLFYLLFISFQCIAQTTFYSRGIGGGGALFFPKINPLNEDEFYVACDMSELFHTTDFGEQYSFSEFKNLSVLNNSTYEFTINPLVAYTNFNDGNEGFPVRTDDGGKTWNKLMGFDANEGTVHKMRVNYNKPNQLIINYYASILISNNGGQTFNVIKKASNNGVGIILSGVFFDGDSIYVATNEGLFWSQNNGNSFTLLVSAGIPNDQVIWDFSAAKNEGITKFVCITGSISDIYNGIMPYEYSGLAKGVYVMMNANGQWMSRSLGINFNSDFVMYTGMALNNTNIIYLGGSDGALNSPLVFKSQDGGITWKKIFQSQQNLNINTGWSGFGGDKNWSWGETTFGIAVAPLNANRIVFSDFGFIHVSKDGGQSWQQAYVDKKDQHPPNQATPTKKYYHSIGLENTSNWQIMWIDSNNMLGCFSDIGLIRSVDAGESWSFDVEGLSVNSTYRITKDHRLVLYAATSNVHDMYQSTRLSDANLDVNDSNGKISFSTDNGKTWKLMHQFNHPVFWVALDPRNNNTMYASVIHYGNGSGQGGIWVSNDIQNGAVSKWFKLTNPPRTEGHPASIQVLKDGNVLCTYSGRRNPSGQFTKSSGLFFYNPITQTWKDLSDPGMYFWTKDVVVDPFDSEENTWYVAVYSGWGGAPNGLGGLYKTENRGLSWQKITGSSFDRVSSITFHPTDRNKSFMTTETDGLWALENMNSLSPSWNLVKSYKFRQPERVYFNPYKPNQMWVSSFGNGMNFSDLTITNLGPEHQDNNMEFHKNLLAPSVFSNKLSIVRNTNQDFKIFNSFGQVILDKETLNGLELIDTYNWVPGLYFAISDQSIQKLIKY